MRLRASSISEQIIVFVAIRHSGEGWLRTLGSGSLLTSSGSLVLC
jgi:hypothetical protein